METIKAELKDRIAFFENEKRYVEMQRIQQRTMYDLEMIRESVFARASRTIRAISVSGNQAIRHPA